MLIDADSMRGASHGIRIVTDGHRVGTDTFDERLSIAMLFEHLVCVYRGLQLLQFCEESVILKFDLQVAMLHRLYVQ